MSRFNTKKIFEALIYWTIPEGIKACFRRIARRNKTGAMTSPGISAIISENAAFKDIHKGERCFILATGPSINRQDIRPFEE